MSKVERKAYGSSGLEREDTEIAEAPDGAGEADRTGREVGGLTVIAGLVEVASL